MTGDIDWSGKKKFIVIWQFLLSDVLLPYGPAGRANYRGPPKGI